MILTHSPAEIVRQLLIDLSLGTNILTSTSLWPVFATSEPDTPDNVITIYDTQGTDGGRSMIDGEFLTHYGFQVRIRSKNHIVGWIKTDMIRHYLAHSVYQKIVHVENNSYLIQAIEKIGNVLAIGKETSISKRNLFTLNATIPLTAL